MNSPSRHPEHGERGFTLLELLISFGLLIVVMAGSYTLLVENAQINRSQQLTSEVQANARNCLSMIVQALRSAGWNPADDPGVNLVDLDPDLTDAVNFITVYADFDADGVTDGPDEEVTIQHDSTTNQISWRTVDGGSFTILAVDISNDSDGDSIAEPMFTPDSVTNPTRITVRITAQSPIQDPRTGNLIRYTLSSDVVLRKAR